MTPREFTIELRAQGERQADEYERIANEAMMMRQAYHAKRLKVSDLYKRRSESETKTADLADMKEKTARTNEWLAQLTNLPKEEASERSDAINE